MPMNRWHCPGGSLAVAEQDHPEVLLRAPHSCSRMKTPHVAIVTIGRTYVRQRLHLGGDVKIEIFGAVLLARAHRGCGLCGGPRGE